MQEHWGRLLLEQSTWAAHHRVERLARKQLGMRLPEAHELEVVLP
jgi:cell division protein FtsL